MKKLAVLSIVLLSGGVYAGEFGLDSVRSADLGAISMEVPAAPVAPEAVKCGHVEGNLEKLNLLAQTSKNKLFAYAENEAEALEFYAFWTPIVEKFGMRVVSTEFKTNYAFLTYESLNGSVIRSFTADKLHYDALSQEAMNKLRHELLEPLEKAGMRPIASFNLKFDFIRPTVNVYYLTKGEENMDHENQLRQLVPGEPIDFDLLQAAGVNFVKKDTEYSLAYIGRNIGYKYKVGQTEASVLAKVEEYKTFLTENKKELIGFKVHRMDEPIELGDTKLYYLANIYFYQ